MTALAPRPRARTLTDEALVDAAIDGDERAWAAICDQHLPQVRAVAHARLRDAHAAEDVVQETFLRAWTRLPQVRDAARLGAWLKTIAANVAIDHVRRQRTTAPLDAARDVPAPGRSHDEVVVAAEEAEVLHGHLGALRDVDRRALWQRDGHGVSVGELATELGMTSGSVRVLLSRARQRVRDGYGVVAAPLVGLMARWRNRFAGLGDAVPVAVAAPALVVAVVAGVGVPSLGQASPDVDTTISVAPTPVRATPVLATDGASPAPSAAPSPRPPAAAPSPAAAAAEPSPVTDDSGPGVDLGSESAGFSDEPPTDDEPDTQAPTSAGPVENLELYLEQSGIGELGEDCILCG